MDDGPPIVIMVIQFLIDISNILFNVFIIYALRKLDKLSNISYWFIFFLSISDCLVGITGLAYDAHALYCSSKQDFSSYIYVSELRSFFLAFSGRLTTVVAIDRSIRMKYLNRYNSIMTRTKANTILIVNTILGLVQFVGNISSLRDIFERTYDVFHFICISSGCIFYLFTYCSIKQRVADLHLNLRHKHSTPATGIEVHTSEVHNNSLKSMMHDKNSQLDGENGVNICHSAKTASLLSKREEGKCEKNDIIIVKETSAHHSHCMNEIHEKLTAETLPNNYNFTTLPTLSIGRSRSYKFGDHQDTVVQSDTRHLKPDTAYKDSSEIRSRRRNEADAGKAMLYIILAMMVCYMPIFVVKILDIWNVDADWMIQSLSLWLLKANSSVNAIILIAFGREIRHFVKSLLQKR